MKARTLYRERECAAPTANWKKIRAAYMARRTRKGSLQPVERDLLKRMRSLVEKVINPQLARVPVHGKGASALYFYGDEQLAEILNSSPRQAKRTREILAEMEVLTIPVREDDPSKKHRQYKKGTYPCWLLSFEFMIDDDHLLIPNPEAEESISVDESPEPRRLKIQVPNLPFIDAETYVREATQLREEFESDAADGLPTVSQWEFNEIVKQVVIGAAQFDKQNPAT